MTPSSRRLPDPDALLVAPVVVQYGIGEDESLLVRFIVAAIAITGIVAAVTISNRRSVTGTVDIVAGAKDPVG